MAPEDEASQAKRNYHKSIDDLLLNVGSDSETFYDRFKHCMAMEAVYKVALLNAAQHAGAEQAEAYHHEAQRIIVGHFAECIRQFRHRQKYGSY